MSSILINPTLNNRFLFNCLVWLGDTCRDAWKYFSRLYQTFFASSSFKSVLLFELWWVLHHYVINLFRISEIVSNSQFEVFFKSRFYTRSSPWLINWKQILLCCQVLITHEHFLEIAISIGFYLLWRIFNSFALI